MIGPFYLNFVHVGNRVFSTQQYLDYSCLCVIPILINLMSASLVQDALYNFFLQMNVFLWISLIGSYSQCPLIINCWHDEIPEFHWSKLGETQNFKLRSPIRWRESGISQIKISEHLFASIIWFIKHKLFKVKMTCNCVGINYRCLIVYVLMILTTLCNAATTFIINTYLQNWLKISRQILYLLEKYYFLTSNPLLLRILTAIVKHSSRQILTLFFTLKFDRLISRSWQIDSINISPKVVFSSASYPMLKVGVSGGGGRWWGTCTDYCSGLKHKCLKSNRVYLIPCTLNY